MIVRYAYKDKNSGKQPFACVVFIDESTFGVSLCSKGDTFSKKTGRMIAVGRALTNMSANTRILYNVKGDVTQNGIEVSRKAALVEVVERARQAAKSYYTNDTQKISVES